MSSPVVRRTVGIVIAAVLVLLGWWLYDPNPDGQVNGRLTNQTNSVTTVTVTNAPPTPSTSDVTPGSIDDESGLPLVPLAELPPEVADTLVVIDQGEPYPYDRDGVTFENREGLLPAHADRVLPRVHGRDSGLGRPWRPSRHRRRGRRALLHRRPLRVLREDCSMSGLARLLAGHTDPGVYHWTSAADARTVEHAAEHAGWRFVALDSWQVEDKSAFLDVCEEAFAFPEWVGHNFDALADALSDVRGPDGAGVVVLWEGWATSGPRQPAGVRRRAERVRRPGGLRARWAVRGTAPGSRSDRHRPPRARSAPALNSPAGPACPR